MYATRVQIKIKLASRKTSIHSNIVHNTHLVIVMINGDVLLRTVSQLMH